LNDPKDYFDFLAKLGLTKHLGSMEATRQLVELAHIQPGQLILDVGCGAGATPVHLAKRLDCSAVAVDLLPTMVKQARRRVAAEGLGASVRLAAADARWLPFRDETFDAVITESVNVFFEDKVRAIREYARVTKPGGYVGITEMTWLAEPSEEKKAYYRRTVYADALQADEWIALLKEAGLEDVKGHAEPVDMAKEGRGRLQRYGCSGFVRVLLNFLVTLFRDRESRAFLGSTTRSIPRDMIKDTGYGVYAGRKA
jgi:ubiquinone/menaquinone biosynthesis C-methylase UbiE